MQACVHKTCGFLAPPQRDNCRRFLLSQPGKWRVGKVFETCGEREEKHNILWWSSDKETALPVQVASLQSLVGEVPHDLWPKKKKRETVSSVLTLPSQSGTCFCLSLLSERWFGLCSQECRQEEGLRCKGPDPSKEAVSKGIALDEGRHQVGGKDGVS